MVSRNYYVYIMTNRYDTVLYTGVTNDLVKRVAQHREKATPGSMSHYNVVKLVYYETYEDVTAAIAREKQIKGGSRKKKVDLVNSMNSEWRDLYEELEQGLAFVGGWGLLRSARNLTTHPVIARRRLPTTKQSPPSVGRHSVGGDCFAPLAMTCRGVRLPRRDEDVYYGPGRQPK